MCAAFAGAAWDGSDDTEPLCWNKNGQTGEYRETIPQEEADRVAQQ